MIRSLGGKYPQIHPTAFVSEFSYVVGDVEIGAEVSIWPGVVLRTENGKMVIGEGTNIQDGSIVHAEGGMTIGKYVTLGHAVVCHATVVGDHCLIGNNATLNSRSRVGDWCIVASGAVVLDGREIPSRSFATGIPAKVAGELQPKHEELIRMNADEYLKLCREYKAEGTLE